MALEIETTAFDFFGGIFPPDFKSPANQSQIIDAPIPDELVLPLGQHKGEPAKPCVQVGDAVLAGQRIAFAQGPFSAPVHAPTSGEITKIELRVSNHESGLKEIAICLAPDGRHQWITKQPMPNYREKPVEAVLHQIRQAGIVGLGGAGFPSHIKVQTSLDEKIQTLIINGVECEPFISADDALMQAHALELLKGAAIMQHLLQPVEILFAVEDNKPQALKALQRAFDQLDDAEKLTSLRLIQLPTKYPSGGEKQLIQLLTNKEVPSGQIPADIGMLCLNVGTLFSIYEAVILGKPLTERITTVTGNCVARPGNYRVMFGTQIQHLLSLSGIRQDQIEQLIIGGPLMGFTPQSAKIPVIKTTNCVIATNRDQLNLQNQEQPCIRCGDCANVCPAQLLPQQLFWYSKHKEFEKALNHQLMDCIECGACAYVCPSQIPLVHYYKFAKGEIRAQRQQKIAADRAKTRFESRLARLEKQAQEKEAKRQARLAKKATLDQKQDQTDPNTLDKKTMIAQALARTKAKKAAAQEKQQQNIRMQKQAEPNQAQPVSQSQQQAPADIKKLTVQAALARSQVKKAKQNLSRLQEKLGDGYEKDQTYQNQLKRLEALQTEANQAALALAQAKHT